MKQLCLYIILFSGLVCVGVCKPREYILIKQLKTWTDAQSYCRLNHYDLATVQTDEDLTNLRQTASEDGMISAGWIGFYNDINTWRWSYQDESVIYSNRYSLGSTMKCASIYPDGYWYEVNCANSYEFMCSDGE
ncbi:snaclec rhodocetin subunit delta-like [Triplophysa dalaica]|uniref:snaclec rhodocetin subunit delta-like n=1 Tax=Triplophysa dalaica TaxID=1582913 RepID=UPI0024DFC66D|nr:snaclec rhodocetin subunit delta-like [Triplophysa dalaica]